MSRFHFPLMLFAAAALSACSAPETRTLATLPAVVGASAPVVAAPVQARDALVERLARLAPDADRGVLALAVEARACAARSGDAPESARLAVIDYTRPSTPPRMWV